MNVIYGISNIERPLLPMMTDCMVLSEVITGVQFALFPLNFQFIF